MKVVVFRAPGAPLEIEDRPIPTPGDGEVLIRVDLCGVCASDLMAVDGLATDYSPPVVLGHEIAGRVVASRATGIDVGALVSVNPMVTCGVCSACRRDEAKYCRSLTGIGHDIDGGFSEYMLAPDALVSQGGLIVYPPDVEPERVLFTEPMGCVANAMAETPFRDTVAILGAGPIGLLFVQAAVLHGLRAYVIEPLAERRAVAERLGAEQTFDNSDESMSELIDATEGGADTVIMASDSPSALGLAFRCARRGGAINLFGLAPKGRTLTLDLEELHFSGHRIQASWAFSRASLAQARDWIADGSIDLSPFVTERYRLLQADAALGSARDRRGIKTVLECRAATA
ncbi:zinc-binding dehydrogenase [Candidatus Poribacteria bacterium]|nr:zinc-binding dehydrogenase [Candidatus Poribacteria bacterium]